MLVESLAGCRGMRKVKAEGFDQPQYRLDVGRDHRHQHRAQRRAKAVVAGRLAGANYYYVMDSDREDLPSRVRFRE